MTASLLKPDLQALGLIGAAITAGLTAFKITRRGREVTLEVAASNVDPLTDDVAARIERMAADGED